MSTFNPNSNLAHARRVRAAVLLAMALGLLIGFTLMAAAVNEHKQFAHWDEQGKELLHDHARRHELPRTLFWLITQLGDARFLITASIVGLIVLLLRQHGRLAVIWGMTTLGGFQLIHLLKQHYDRPRPEFLEPLIAETSKSFPSFHAAGSAMFYGMLAYLIICYRRRAGWYIAPLLGLLIAIIGFSRIYLGAHWFSDVLGGFMLGLGWVCLGMSAAEITREY